MPVSVLTLLHGACATWCRNARLLPNTTDNHTPNHTTVHALHAARLWSAHGLSPPNTGHAVHIDVPRHGCSTQLPQPQQKNDAPNNMTTDNNTLDALDS